MFLYVHAVVAHQEEYRFPKPDVAGSSPANRANLQDIDMTPILCFVTNSGNVCRLGTFIPLNKHDLKMYVHKFPIHWIECNKFELPVPVAQLKEQRISTPQVAGLSPAGDAKQ